MLGEIKMNKLQVINRLKEMNIDTERLNLLKDTDILHLSYENTQIDYQSEDYDMIKELYNERQEEGSYSGTMVVMNGKVCDSIFGNEE